MMKFPWNTKLTVRQADALIAFLGRGHRMAFGSAAREFGLTADDVAAFVKRHEREIGRAKVAHGGRA